MTTTAYGDITHFDLGLKEPDIRINKSLEQVGRLTSGIFEKNVAATTSPYTLIDSGLGYHESQHAAYRYHGTRGSALTVVHDPTATPRLFIVENDATTQTLTVKVTSGGVGVDIASGSTKVLMHDGTDVAEASGATGSSAASARVYHNANQSISNGASTALAFNSERWDTDTIHDNATNNSRLTCKTAGKYLIIGQVRWAANATGVRQCWIQDQAGTTWGMADEPTPGGAVVSQNVMTIIDMSVNNYVELYVYQSSGGALNVDAASNYSPAFMFVKVA